MIGKGTFIMNSDITQPVETPATPPVFGTASVRGLPTSRRRLISMHHRFIRQAVLGTFVGVVVSALVLGGVAGASGSGYQGLMGKRVPGTTKTWLPIASPYTHPKDVAGTSTPPVITDSSSTADSVSFFEFPSSAKAEKFATALPDTARLYAAGIQRFAPTTGPLAIPAPVEWYDLQECLYAAGQAAPNAVGEPSGGKMSASGTCTSGTAGSIGFAEAIQRGKVVALVETLGGGSVLGSDGANAAIDVDVVTANETYAKGTVALMKSVGLIGVTITHKKSKK
jgi:hypothetical protein